MDGGRESEEQAGGQSHGQGEPKHREIEFDLADLRKDAGVQAANGHHAEFAQYESRGAAEQREQQAFGEKLTNDAPLSPPRDARTAISFSRAELRASRRLAMLAQAMSRTIPVAAMNQHGGADLGNQLFAQRNHNDAPPRGCR